MDVIELENWKSYENNNFILESEFVQMKKKSKPTRMFGVIFAWIIYWTRWKNQKNNRRKVKSMNSDVRCVCIVLFVPFWDSLLYEKHSIVLFPYLYTNISAYLQYMCLYFPIYFFP